MTPDETSPPPTIPDITGADWVERGEVEAMIQADRLERDGVFDDALRNLDLGLRRYVESTADAVMRAGNLRWGLLIATAVLYAALIFITR